MEYGRERGLRGNGNALGNHYDSFFPPRRFRYGFAALLMKLLVRAPTNPWTLLGIPHSLNYSHRLRLHGCMFIPGNVPNPTRAISSMELALISIRYQRSSQLESKRWNSSLASLH